MIQNCHSRYKKKKKKKIGLETRKKLASNDNNFVILCFGGSRASGKKIGHIHMVSLRRFSCIVSRRGLLAHQYCDRIVY